MINIGADVRDVHRGRAQTLLRENLDSRVDGREMMRIIRGLYTVQNHSRSARRFRIRGHLQLLLAGWLELRMSDDRKRSSGQCKAGKRGYMKTHGSISRELVQSRLYLEVRSRSRPEFQR